LLPLLADKYHLIAARLSPASGHSRRALPVRAFEIYLRQPRTRVMNELTTKPWDHKLQSLFMQGLRRGPLASLGARPPGSAVRAIICPERRFLMKQGLEPAFGRRAGKYLGRIRPHELENPQGQLHRPSKRRASATSGPVRNPDRYDPDTWTDEYGLFSPVRGPGRHSGHGCFPGINRTNVASYTLWQKGGFREVQAADPLVVWGGNTTPSLHRRRGNKALWPTTLPRARNPTSWKPDTSRLDEATDGGSRSAWSVASLERLNKHAE